MRFRSRSVLDRHRTHRAFHHLVERDHDVALDITTARGKIFLCKTAARARAASMRAKNLLEKIAETRAAKFKFRRASSAKSTRLSCSTPARRRTKLRSRFPIRAEFIVFFSLGRIAQYFVSLVDLLEFFLGLFFIFRHVTMKFVREFAKCFF